MMEAPARTAQGERCPDDILETTTARVHPEVGQYLGSLMLLGNQFTENIPSFILPENK